MNVLCVIIIYGRLKINLPLNFVWPKLLFVYFLPNWHGICCHSCWCHFNHFNFQKNLNMLKLNYFISAYKQKHLQLITNKSLGNVLCCLVIFVSFVIFFTIWLTFIFDVVALKEKKNIQMDFNMQHTKPTKEICCHPVLLAVVVRTILSNVHFIQFD